MAKSPKIHELWHVTPCSTAFFERIPNLCLKWSNSVKLWVKCTSNRVLLVKNGKIPKDSWIMTCDPLLDYIFREHSEFYCSFSINSWSDNKTITSFHLIKSWTMIYGEYLFLLINLTIFNEEMWKRLAIVKKPRALINQRAFFNQRPLIKKHDGQ